MSDSCPVCDKTAKEHTRTKMNFCYSKFLESLCDENKKIDSVPIPRDSDSISTKMRFST